MRRRRSGIQAPRELRSADHRIQGPRRRLCQSGHTPHRKKFSTGHELGHWHHHRGQSFVCRSSDIGKPFDEKSKDAERQADAYSGDLILPPFMVGPKLENSARSRLDGIADLASQFKASVTATAIRTMRMTKQPLDPRRAQSLWANWQWPSVTAGTDTRSGRRRPQLFGVCFHDGRQQGVVARKEPANYWFDRRHVEQFDVRVQSFRTVEGEVLTLLRVLDPRMMEIYG